MTANRLQEIEERLARIDAAIPQRDVAECWGEKHLFSDCKECEAHSAARGKFNKASHELHDNGQSDLRWLVHELRKERQKVTELVAGLVAVASWSTKDKSSKYCWHDHRSCLRADGHSSYDTCELANKALASARKG